jgi:hypothetical protein
MIGDNASKRDKLFSKKSWLPIIKIVFVILEQPVKNQATKSMSSGVIWFLECTKSPVKTILSGFKDFHSDNAFVRIER